MPNGPTYDMPQNYYFGGASETLVTPLALVVLLLSSVLLVTLPRRYAAAAFLAGSMLMPYGLKLAIGPLHFFFSVFCFRGRVALAGQAGFANRTITRLDKFLWPGRYSMP